MNGKECLLAFADLDESTIAAAKDTEAIRRSFYLLKKRRTRMIGAASGLFIVVFILVGFNSNKWFRRMPAVMPSETDITDHTMPGAPSSETPSTASGFIPPETQTTPLPGETELEPTQGTEPSSVISPAADATTEAPESAFEKAYCYSLNDSEYAAYISGKVISPDRVGEKIGEATVTAGWKYADGAMPVTEQLRCEIYRIKNIDPATAICIRFLDKGEALTTDHYYVQINASADLSAVSEYIIPSAVSDGEE